MERWDGQVDDRVAMTSVLVGVDGSDESRSAVRWAVAEATGERCTLELLAVADDLGAGHRHSVTAQDRARHALAEAVEEARSVLPSSAVHAEMLHGRPADVLVDRGTDAAIVVVGRHGHDGLAHLLAGSTTVAVAAGSLRMVAVVPGPWKPLDHDAAPVLLGVDPWAPDLAAVDVAFGRAGRLGVPVVAVHGWEMPAVSAWDEVGVGEMTARWAQESETELDRLLAGWRWRFPDADVRKVHVCRTPSGALLDAADHAQLVVLGRHGGAPGSGRRRGRGPRALGSVTRAVLHHCPCPVLVVPGPPLEEP